MCFNGWKGICSTSTTFSVDRRHYLCANSHKRLKLCENVWSKFVLDNFHMGRFVPFGYLFTYARCQCSTHACSSAVMYLLQWKGCCVSSQVMKLNLWKLILQILKYLQTIYCVLIFYSIQNSYKKNESPYEPFATELEYDTKLFGALIDIHTVPSSIHECQFLC